jgi:hypothetical protein
MVIGFPLWHRPVVFHHPFRVDGKYQLSEESLGQADILLVLSTFAANDLLVAEWLDGLACWGGL